ncbi:MAG: hypothetical protein CL946_06895 [Ectothiorhodospiraceae bacterium]|nr:hypothetical protein [Ectothiorhodospiraceae bacterium]
MAKVALLKSWWLNIGDGFVKIGAEHILREVFGQENVSVCSALGANKFEMIGDGAANPDFPSLLDVIADDLEVVAIAGCVLNEKLVRLARKLEGLPNKPKIVFLGAGGYGYDKATVSKIRETLERIEPFLLVARDHESLEHYGDLFDHSYKGMDCAYWVADAVSPVESDSKYTIRTFNRMLDPGRSAGKVIRCEHVPLRPSIEPRARSILRNIYRLMKPETSKQDYEAFYSDDVGEYLKLYSGACEVHTDMVHATVASVSYGIPVQMYYRSGREGVLTSVLGDEVFKRLFVGDLEDLNQKKNTEIGKLKKIFAK